MSLKLIKSLKPKSAMDNVAANTTRTGNKRRLIHNNILLEQILAAEPSLNIKSKSITQAVKTWGLHIISTKPSASIIRHLLKLFHRLVPTLAGNDLTGYHTTVSIYKHIRAAISKTYGQTHNLVRDSNVLMRVNQTLFKKYITKYDAGVVAKNQGGADVYDAGVIYNILDDVVNSDDWRSLAIGIELASGARINEVLSYSTFSESDKDGWIIQHGISKQGRAPKFEKGMTHGDYLRAVEVNNKNKITEVEKPVIHITPAQLLTMVSKMRNKLKSEIEKVYVGDQTSTQLAQRLNPKINRALSKLLPNTTTHTLRKIYSHLAYKLHGGDMSEAGFISKVLAHKHGNLSTAKSYSTVRVTNNVSAPTDLVAEITKLREMFKQLATQPKSKDTTDLDGIPHNTRARDGKVFERLAVSISALEDSGINPSVATLRRLGYGSGTISAYRRRVV